MRMNREQRARLFALYQDVCVLCTGAQPERAERMPGTDEQAERMLGEIKTLLHIERADVPLSVLEENVADLAARRKARQQLDHLVEKRMARAEKEYYDSVRLELIGEMGGAENAGTRRKLAELVVREGICLTSPAFAQARPRRAQELVGQREAFGRLCAALCSPFPQHVLLYGPPGCGKTTAARLALDAAREQEGSPFMRSAPFVEADASTLRCDPHGGVNPLIGSVHDPIYQGAGRELAGRGLPEPKLGLVTQAHGGVLFLDEIGEMDAQLQNMLLKVLEDKRVRFDSSYFDADAPGVPGYIRQLFDQGAPADFVLIGATTRNPAELPAALRSRCVEIFFDALDERALLEVARGAAQRLNIHATAPALRYIAARSCDGRDCVRKLTAAQKKGRVTLADVRQDAPPRREEPQAGRIAILGVQGRQGVVCTLTGALTPGTGRVHLDLSAGKMARDAAQCALLALQAGGEALGERDAVLHVEGGSPVDGPSLGLAAALVLRSLLRGAPLRQDAAVTGEIALDGRVLPVGGITEKRVAARLNGYARIVEPEGSPAAPDVEQVQTLEQAWHIFDADACQTASDSGK